MPSPKHSEGPFWPDGARLTFRADDGLEIVWMLEIAERNSEIWTGKFAIDRKKSLDRYMDGDPK